MSVLLFGFAAASNLEQDAMEFRFAPREGLVLRRHFERVQQEETVTDREGETTSAASSSTVVLVVVDRFVAVEDSRVMRLERTFQEVHVEAARMIAWPDFLRPQELESQAESPLVGKTVTFDWDPESEQYLATGDVEDGLLSELRLNLGVSALLPKGEVEFGESWRVGPMTYAEVTRAFMQGVPLEWEDLDEESGKYTINFDEAPAVMESDLCGEVTLTYRGCRRGEEDGLLALVELEGEIRIEGQRKHEGLEMERVRVATIEGWFLWDVDHNHLRSVNLESSIKGEGLTENWAAEDDRRGDELRSKWNTEGQTTLTVTFKRVK